MMNNNSQRYWELDFLRGLAIVSMVIYHALVDLAFLKDSPFRTTGFNFYWQEGTAMLFLIISGIGATLSNFKNGSELKPGFKKVMRRGLVLLGWGMIITVTTAIFIREELVVFGILHLMGVGAILQYPLRKYKFLNLGLGVGIVLLGKYLDGYRFGFPWLVWLGLMPRGFCSIDYFPILPWFGYLLIGIFLGKTFYPQGVPKYGFKNYSGNPIIKSLCFFGRHSLKIYLIHQPLLLALLSLLIYIP